MPKKLVMLLAQRDIDEALTAQHDYSGAEAMRKLNLTSYYELRVAARPQVKKDLARLRKKLGWSKNRLTPSVWFMAKQAGEQRLYNFLYHATSRFVHFNVGELLRRAWGTPGELVLSSEHFERYWARFSLYWGMKLYFDVLALALEHLHEDVALDDAAGERLLSLVKELQPLAMVPIITAAELRWSEG